MVQFQNGADELRITLDPGDARLFYGIAAIGCGPVNGGGHHASIS
jgi:hypothetical protein